jgi:benzoyl-CoA reductase/2-hydroxyglutaryl-CoA dehydratase subunit BcrC/BadD/HgdB
MCEVIDVTDENEWLTVTDLSQKFGIPDATLRRYIRQHGHHLKLRKHHKSYLVALESIDVLVRIREAYAEGKGMDDVENALAAAHAPTFITVTEVNDDGEQVTVNVAEALSSLQKTVNDQNEMIRALGQLLQNKQQVAATLSDPAQQRLDRLNERIAERRVENKLRDEAEEIWNAKPVAERMKKVGLIRKAEDMAARERFIRKYIDEHFETRLRAAYEGEIEK